ncbi:MAG: DUF3450 domain-containing protein [Kiritimatiellaeota bacterium]|nr:DUF3450 domain-containing protein [Kiritimatiellota bacterium]
MPRTPQCRWKAARPPFILAVYLLSAGLLPPDPARAGPPPADGQVKTAAGTMARLVDRWVRLREELNRAETRWREQKAVLADERRMLEREQGRAQAAWREQEAADRELSAELARVTDRRTALANVLSRLEQPVRQAEEDLRLWQRRLPDFLAARLRDRFRELPGPGRQFKPTDLSKRLERVLGLYAEIEQLDQSVHSGRMILKGPDGRQLEMRVLFLGLGAGFALTPDGKAGGRGVPGTDGWRWEWRPQWAQSVRTALECYAKVRPAEFVPLALEVAGGTP